MSEWRSWHVHHGDLDRLLAECVHPVLERVEPWVERRFWERHYAGGTHLRVRLRGAPEALERAGREVEYAARAFLAAHPSPDQATYSAARAAALLEREGERVDAEELVYRNNVVVVRPYPVDSDVYVSPEAAELARDFRHDSMGLAMRIVTGARPRREEMLRLFLFQALAVAGRLEEGSVSYKSHWEGLSAGSPPQVGERIRAAYRASRDGVAALLREVADAWEADRGAGDPVLAEWGALLDRYGRRTEELLRAGTQVTPQPATLEDARALRDAAYASVGERSAFVRTLWADERFLASIQFEESFLVPRVLVNLLYVLVGAVGLSPVDKMMLCHHAHAAVEDHFGRSLDAILERNVAGIVGAHAHRWE
ncbi:MAG TPA: lantibiotic dehydratase C-terminal domain-containing protein [Longimicrobium sp.]|nr:lantibiotic dehydratase C-terminal domain-containing protein [Longimicrobium sp.]